MVVVKAAGQGSGVKKVKVKKTKHANNSIHLLFIRILPMQLLIVNNLTHYKNAPPIYLIINSY